MAGNSEQRVFTTLLRQATEIDQLPSASQNQELMLALAAIRRHLEAAITLLGERVEEPPKSARQRAHERSHPWDIV